PRTIRAARGLAITINILRYARQLFGARHAAGGVNKGNGRKTENNWIVLEKAFVRNVATADGSRRRAEVGNPDSWDDHGPYAHRLNHDRVGAGTIQGAKTFFLRRVDDLNLGLHRLGLNGSARC